MTGSKRGGFLCIQYGFLLLFGWVIGASISSMPASAVTPKTAISISPPLFEISANPGDTIKHTVRVDNLVDQELPLKVLRKDFVAMGEEGQAALTDDTSGYSLASWMKVSSSSFTLDARQSKTIAFTIKVPEKAEPGGHFGSVVFKTTPPKNTRTGLAVGQEIGALVLLKVAGEVNENGHIIEFAPTRSVWEGAPIEFATRFRNDGNVQLKPTGSITVNNMFGQKIDEISVDARTVLPDSVRKVTSKWEQNLWPGWYNATVSLGYGTRGQLVTATTSFFIFPYKIIIPLLVVLAALGVVIYRGRRRISRSLRILLGKE